MSVLVQSTVPPAVLYAEGTYTPAPSASTGSPSTWDNVVGRYTKIGRTVLWSAAMRITNIGSMSGVLRISLPSFTPAVGQSCSAVKTNTGAALYGFINTAGYAELLTVSGVFPVSNNDSISVSGFFIV